jgi:hypothetical protein
MKVRSVQVSDCCQMTEMPDRLSVSRLCWPKITRLKDVTVQDVCLCPNATMHAAVLSHIHRKCPRLNFRQIGKGTRSKIANIAALYIWREALVYRSKMDAASDRKSVMDALMPPVRYIVVNSPGVSEA